MSPEVRRRTASDVLKKGYSDEEVMSIYELARLSLDLGEVKRAEALFAGLNEVSPDFSPAWLGTAYVQLIGGNIHEATFSCRQALRINPVSGPSLLYLIVALLANQDFQAAGTYLGEFGERIDAGAIGDPLQVRFYKVLLQRYKNKR